MKIPRISIVIPSFNQGHFVEQAILSVLGQFYPNLELIVIDGGSTDNTVAVLEEYADRLAYWVSEPDEGQTHAINKGLRRATGDIVAWLNTDDMYMPGALRQVADALAPYDVPRLIYGACLHFYEGRGRAWAYMPEAYNANRLRHFDYLVQPSTFWTRALWKATGELDESLNYTLDWDWYIRASRFVDFTPLPSYLSIYRKHEHHKTGVGGKARAREVVRIVETYGDAAWADAYRDIYAVGPRLKAGIQRLKRWRLNRFKTLFYPAIYRKHGVHRVDTALTMLLP